ncbi:MAG: alcohol dehydrogenase family protein [Bacteroidia bacterium]|nr:alcohol dehydrogenase family protein [Bacteroidia bacterium]
MKALTFQGIRDIRYESAPDPVILSPGDAIVKVRYTAVCGSDLHIYHGRESGLDTGTVMGHEFVGEIVETGHGVKTLKKGDAVVSPFTTSCGECYYCRIGLTCRCERGQLYGWVEKGHGLHGAQAEYVRVPLADTTLVRYSPEIDAAQALLTGDIMATGYFCADQAEVRPGGVYAVVGCGPVGLMAILGAKEKGAETIFAIDSIAERLEWAAKLGAVTVDFQQNNPVEVIRAFTHGRGADAVLEAVGSPSAAKLAYYLVRPGGIISTVGVHTRPEFSFSPAQAYDKNLTFRIGRCPARFYMEKLLDKIQNGQMDLLPFISRIMPLSEGRLAYEKFDQKEPGYLKVILAVG